MEKIKFIDWGTACRIGDIIYINQSLKQHPELFSALLKHEKQHSSTLTFKDIKIDLKISELDNLRGDYYRFILAHPKTWIMFLPFWKYEGKWILDPSILGAWMIGIALGGILWRLL